ncbi:MAG: hypothetical protein LBR71_04705 [Synergistaceae bacterium]|nr:hypothetical protein [Synergistaceae bacterium]
MIVVPMLLGGLWRLNEYCLWMSFRELSVEAADPALERRFWDVFPSSSLRFWPFFARKSKDIEAFMERTLPVLTDIRLKGFGRFTVRVQPLTPRMIVEWRGEVWCVSREGRMWNAGDRSLWIPGLEIPRKPLWRVASLSEVSGGGDGLSAPGGVFPSLVSIDFVEDFLSAFGGESWFEDVREVSLERRAGSDLFRLRLVRGQQEFTLLIQRDKYEGKGLNETLRHVLDILSKEGGSHIVDATYKNKIVVRGYPRLSTGAAEGSSK